MKQNIVLWIYQKYFIGGITMTKETERTLELLKLGMNSFSDALKELWNAAEKNVCVELDDKALEILKSNKYKLCFAKKVGEADYNVVWQSYDAYENFNNFSWVPLYQIFVTKTFKESVVVKVSSKQVKIGLGEQVTRDENGVLSEAITGGDGTALNLVNEGNMTHVGVNQLSVGIDGSEISTPIYVSQESILKGEIHLQPKEKVLVWFEQNIETGTMFSTSRSKAIEIDLTSRNSINIAFDGTTMEWRTI